MRPVLVALSVLLVAVVAPPPVGAAPSPGSDPTCGTGAPVTWTSGAGDPALPSLVFAALKTGFRAVVAWETSQPTTASLKYSLDAGTRVTVKETVPRTQHVFVIDELPVGRTLCFTPQDTNGDPVAAPQALRLANAMNAFEDGAYTINLLTLANEQPNVPLLESHMIDFATIVHDMTDGHVRIGRMVIVYGDVENHNSGWVTCYITGVVRNLPHCHDLYDVLFTSDASPTGAASTYLDGIQHRRQAIWMNSYHQAGLVNTGDATGLVLAHELGHYAFGAMDLYTGNGGPDCWSAALGISVMGGNRQATELDDRVNRCPNEAVIEDYDPSWGRLRERFPLIPDRTVIDAGPPGDGGKFEVHAFHVTPQATAAEPPRIEQNDAESGGDAGNFIQSATPIQTGRLYEGILLSPIDGADVYTFTAPAGSAVEVRAYPRHSCFQLLRADGSSTGSGCVVDALGVSRRVTSDGEPLYIRFSLGHGPYYRFGVGVDAAAPGPV